MPREYVFIVECGYAGHIVLDEEARVRECTRFARALESVVDSNPAAFRRQNSNPWKLTHFVDGFVLDLPMAMEASNVEAFRAVITTTAQRTEVTLRTLIVGARQE